MFKLKWTCIKYQFIGEADDQELMIALHFRLYVDEICRHVGINTVCGVDFFVNNHKADKDGEIVKMFDNRFKNALIAFIKKQRLEMHLITENLLSDANTSIWKSVEHFAKHDDPYIINLGG